MGLDGGTIITRTDVLRGQSWAVANSDDSRSTRGGQVQAGFSHRKERAEGKVKAQARWSTCALTGEALRAPVVACDLGLLYNKESVLEHMLGSKGVFVSEQATYALANREDFLTDFVHLRSPKDVFDLQWQQLESSRAGASASGGAATVVVYSEELGAAQPPAAFLCPLTHQRCDAPGVGFSALRPCGHVLSDRALAQVKADAACPLCSAPFTEEQVVPLNGPNEQVERRREMLREARRHRNKANKGKKAKRLGEGSGPQGALAAGLAVEDTRRTAAEAEAEGAGDASSKKPRHQ